MWKENFSEIILERGWQYYKAGHVENVVIENKKVRGTVLGNDDYNVLINLNIYDDMDCDCPHALSGNHCKHMAALLFYVENEFNQDETIEKNEILRLVNDIDVKALRGFLVEAMNKDEKLLHNFKRTFITDFSKEDINQYKQIIDGIFDEYSDYYGFIDYRSARDFFDELEVVLDEDVRDLISKKHQVEAFELSSYVYMKVAKQDVDDSDGGIMYISRYCLQLWYEILEKSNFDIKKKMFMWFVNNIEEISHYGMEDHLEEILFGDFKEREFLEEKLKLTEKMIHKYNEIDEAWSKEYQLGKWSLYHLETMIELNFEYDLIKSKFEENLQFSEVRSRYIEYCIIKTKDYEKAIELLMEGKEQGEKNNRMGLVYDYSVKLKDLFKDLKRMVKYKEELWYLVLNFSDNNSDLFLELKSLYTDEEWLEKREIVFEQFKNHYQVAELFLLEGLYDRLIEKVINYPSLSLVTQYEEVLKDKYPIELLNKYVEEVNQHAKEPTGRKSYKNIVNILRNMATYPNGRDKAIDIINEWRIKYKNRPAMMDELNKF